MKNQKPAGCAIIAEYTMNGKKARKFAAQQESRKFADVGIVNLAKYYD